LNICNIAECKKHPKGCGPHLEKSDIVKVCGDINAKLVGGKVWYFLARRMNGMKHHCYVGVVKVLATQAHLVANRLARVLDIHGKEACDNKTKNLGIICSHADMKFMDLPEHSD
jgi:hypothetical protein